MSSSITRQPTTSTRRRYESLVPDDLLDVVAERGLGWDSESDSGVVLHMVSALAVAGRIGLTAIGDDLEQARGLYYQVKCALDEAAGGARMGVARD